MLNFLPRWLPDSLIPALNASALRLLLLTGLSLAVTASVVAETRAVRLSEVLAVRFVTTTAGSAQMEVGMLNASSAFRIFERQVVDRSIDVPLDAVNRLLISGTTWFAYDVLGSSALSNFAVGSPPIFVGEQVYLPIAASENPQLESGELINLSTRAFLAPGKEPIISGFVVSGGPRRVLIRGVGPGLKIHGVADALSDPSISVFRQGSDQPIASNGDWGRSNDANAIEQAATVTGAFALSRDSRDAACLVSLEPGVYTVHVTATDTASGTALVEVYSLP